MNNRSIVVNSVLAISFLISSAHVFGMEKELVLASVAATEYNNNILLRLPQDILIQEIVHTKKPLNDFIQTTLSLKNSCKQFNAMLSLDWLKKASKDYGQEEKDKVMKELLLSMNDSTYWNDDNRRKAIILTYLGADNQAAYHYPLLQRAIHQEDRNMIFVLFKNNVNPCQKTFEIPNFFYIKNIDLLQMFINQGLDVNTEGDGLRPNVLW